MYIHLHIIIELYMYMRTENGVYGFSDVLDERRVLWAAAVAELLRLPVGCHRGISLVVPVRRVGSARATGLGSPDDTRQVSLRAWPRTRALGGLGTLPLATRFDSMSQRWRD